MDGKSQEKPVLFRVGGKAGILYQVRGILNSTSRSLKSQEILFLVSHEVWKTIVSKQFFEGIDVWRRFRLWLYCQRICLAWMVSEKSPRNQGIFCFNYDEWQPCLSITVKGAVLPILSPT